MRPNATAQNRVAQLPVNPANFNVYAGFSPDARSIFYTMSDKFAGFSPGELWTVNTDGSGQRRLATDLANSAFSVVSPDSRTAGYAKNEVRQSRHIFRSVDIATGAAADSGSANGYGHFYKTKDQVLTWANGSIGFEPFGGGAGTTLFTPTTGASLWGMSPSPDHSRIALHFHYDNGMNPGMPMNELWMIHTDGRNPIKLATALSPEFFANFGLHWSADSRTFAYSVSGLSSGNGLYVLTPGATSGRLIHTAKQVIGYCLSPDGSYISYQINSSDTLHLMRTDGTGELTIPNFPGGVLAWGW